MKHDVFTNARNASLPDAIVLLRDWVRNAVAAYEVFKRSYVGKFWLNFVRIAVPYHGCITATQLRGSDQTCEQLARQDQ